MNTENTKKFLQSENNFEESCELLISNSRKNQLDENIFKRYSKQWCIVFENEIIEISIPNEGTLSL